MKCYSWEVSTLIYDTVLKHQSLSSIELELAVNELKLSLPTGPPLSQQRQVRLNQGWQLLFGINVSVP